MLWTWPQRKSSRNVKRSSPRRWRNEEWNQQRKATARKHKTTGRRLPANVNWTPTDRTPPFILELTFPLSLHWSSPPPSSLPRWNKSPAMLDLLTEPVLFFESRENDIFQLTGIFEIVKLVELLEVCLIRCGQSGRVSELTLRGWGMAGMDKSGVFPVPSEVRLKMKVCRYEIFFVEERKLGFERCLFEISSSSICFARFSAETESCHGKRGLHSMHLFTWKWLPPPSLSYKWSEVTWDFTCPSFDFAVQDDVRIQYFHVFQSLEELIIVKNQIWLLDGVSRDTKHLKIQAFHGKTSKKSRFPRMERTEALMDLSFIDWKDQFPWNHRMFCIFSRNHGWHLQITECRWWKWSLELLKEKRLKVSVRFLIVGRRGVITVESVVQCRRRDRWEEEFDLERSVRSIVRRDVEGVVLLRSVGRSEVKRGSRAGRERSVRSMFHLRRDEDVRRETSLVSIVESLVRSFLLDDWSRIEDCGFLRKRSSPLVDDILQRREIRWEMRKRGEKSVLSPSQKSRFFFSCSSLHRSNSLSVFSIASSRCSTSSAKLWRSSNTRWACSRRLDEHEAQREKGLSPFSSSLPSTRTLSSLVPQSSQISSSSSSSTSWSISSRRRSSMVSLIVVQRKRRMKTNGSDREEMSLRRISPSAVGETEEWGEWLLFRVCHHHH